MSYIQLTVFMCMYNLIQPMNLLKSSKKTLERISPVLSDMERRRFVLYHVRTVILDSKYIGLSQACCKLYLTLIIHNWSESQTYSYILQHDK